jgi:SAM-dependent methyltransferase
MTNYKRLYRLGITPWERYGQAAAASIAAHLDREETGRSRPLGRALDLGCGRGQFTPELARRGWEAVGIDYVPAAIEAAKSRGAAGVTYVVGDVTNLPAAGLGRFDFFLDVGCFQGFRADERLAEGRGASALANHGAKRDPPYRRRPLWETIWRWVRAIRSICSHVSRAAVRRGRRLRPVACQRGSLSWPVPAPYSGRESGRAVAGMGD